MKSEQQNVLEIVELDAAELDFVSGGSTDIEVSGGYSQSQGGHAEVTIKIHL